MRALTSWGLFGGLVGGLFGSLVSMVTGCTSVPSFICQDDSACAGVGPDAVCEPIGFCSFGDEACDSGRRYGELAGGGLGGQCVGESGSSGPTSTDGPTPTGGGSLDVGDTDQTPDNSGDTGSETDSIPVDWWDCDWSRRRTLTIEAPSLGETLADVPVLIVLNDTRIDPTIMAPDGHDLRFVLDDGTVLPFDIEQWQPRGLSWVWVSVPELSPAGTTIGMYYGNPGAPALDETATWSDYDGVWHMDGTLTDASLHNTIDLAESDTIGGQVGNAQIFYTTSQGINVAPGKDVGDLFSRGGTITAMIRPSDWGGDNKGPIVTRDTGDDNGDDGWAFLIDGSRESLRFGRGFEVNRLTWYSPDGSVELNRWIHVAVTYDDNDVPALYVDGVALRLEETGMAMGVPDADTAPFIRIGGDPLTSDSGFEGRIDEVRLAPILRSPDWIAVQSASLRDELVTYGAPQSCPTPG